MLLQACSGLIYRRCARFCRPQNDRKNIMRHSYKLLPYDQSYVLPNISCYYCVLGDDPATQIFFSKQVQSNIKKCS